MAAVPGGAGPEIVFRRQEQKRHVLVELIDRLQLARGDRVLEVGCGPGLVSLLAAERVGPEGVVWALDLSRPALDYLAARSAERGLVWVRTLEADAAEFDPPAADLNRFLVVDMLHRAGDPAAVLQRLGRVLPPGARGVVSDYRPAAVRRFGAELERRIPEERARGWLEEAHLTIVASWEPPDEHYAFLVERPAGPSAAG